MGRELKVSLATRYGVIFALLAALIGSAVMLVNFYYLERYSQESTNFAQQQLTAVMEKQLINDAEIVTETIANNIDVVVYNLDFSEMYRQLSFLNEEGDVLYAFIYDSDYRVIHDDTAEAVRFGQSVKPWLPDTVPRDFSEYTQKRGRFVHVGRYITAGGERIGMLSVAISYTGAEEDIRQFTAGLASKSLTLQKQITTWLLVLISVGLLVAGIAVFIFSRRLLSPLRALAEYCRRYADGDKNMVFLLKRDDEIGQLAEALEEMRTAIALSQSKIEALAYQDPLTLLPNRRHFNRAIEDMISTSRERRRSAAVVFIDLDRFKEVNDTVGHVLGDQLLKDAAQRLMHCLRDLEGHYLNKPEFYLARLGGDEFVLLVQNYSDKAYLRTVAERILATFKAPFTMDEHRFSLSASVGITLYPDNANNAIDLLKQADIAMYDVKSSGRHGYRFYDERMDVDVAHDLMIRTDILEALTTGQLFLVYQPIVNLKTGGTEGAEALIRWNHPKKGLMNPASFIPLLEKSELIVPLTLWVLRQACYDLKHALLPLKPDFKLSVNVSGKATEDEMVRHEVTELMQRYEIPLNCLHVELTETSLMENLGTCTRTLQAWNDAGADIWVDDFGTGYSSLNYLHQLPINGLKIDRSFVEGMDDPASLRIVETIINLASALHLEIVAEGIETAEQHETLKRLGSHCGQGYLFSRPIPLDEFKARLVAEIERTNETS